MKYGNKKVLELLLRSGADPNLANKKSETPLHLIAKGIYMEDDIVKIFFMTIDDIQQRLLIDALDGRSQTPLFWAVTYWNKKAVELLLKRGASPNLGDADGFAPLHILCCSNWDLVENFLKMNAEIGQTVNINIQTTAGNTPLHLAVSLGNEKVVELLLRQGADPNLANNDGDTALHLICKRYGDNDLMKILFEVCDQLKKKVQVDVRDQLGNTPLHWALFHGQKKEVEFLLKRGANPNACNSELVTPLHRIALRGMDDNLAEVFFAILVDLQLTVDIDAQDVFNNTPLHLALEHKHKQMSETLLRRGADPCVADEDGSTALHIICKGDDVNGLAKMFIKVLQQVRPIVHVDTQDNEGNTPLH
uniref:Uncharacterized protein n=1 Tax=Trichogramma kaykai TaxID=54128 RepID=A0ABD2XEW2_9HYME